MVVKCALSKIPEKNKGKERSLAFRVTLFFVLFLVTVYLVVFMISLRQAQGILWQLFVPAIFTVPCAAYLYLIDGVDKQNRRMRELSAAVGELKEERDTIAAMRDARKVGLFLMDKNFVIQDQYSGCVKTVLGVKDPCGKKFTDLIARSVSESEISSLIKYFVLLFSRSAVFRHNIDERMLENLNPIREMVYTSPETGEVKNIRCNFVPLDRGNGRLFIMGNIQDITREKKMQGRLAELYERAKQVITNK
jgi:hypothetical protein